jgi:P27 family predicted phage terminase small subunit
MMPRQSDEQHALHGTKSAAPPESAAPAGRPRVPKHLSADARKIFRDTVRELQKRRSCTTADARIIELLAIAVERHRQALQHIMAEGAVVTYTRLNNHGEEVPTTAKNIWLGIAQEAEGKITSLLDRLGFSPLNRSRVRPASTEENGLGIKFL